MTARIIDLDVEGMTCASCVSHVTTSLESLPGVTASVNLATERARVDAPESVSDDELVAAIVAAGYTAHVHGDETADADRSQSVTLAQRLVVSIILTLPVLLISMIPAWQFDYWQYLMFMLATPVVFWSGWPFHRAAWANLRRRTASMDTLVSVGTLSAWGWSTWAIMFGHASHIGMRHEWALVPSNTDASMNIYFETAAVLVTVILLGRWLEERSRRTAGAALHELSRLLPTDVRLLDATGSAASEALVPRGQVQAGQLIAVLAGDTIPFDGVVTEGHGLIDAAVVTGESLPQAVQPDSVVMAGSVALDARLVMRATHVGDDTRIAQLTELVDQAQVAKSSVQRLADRISAVFVPAVLSIALVTGIVWWIASGNLGLAFSIAIAVVIIACPCALGLATPVAIMAGTGRGAQLGIIISGPDAIERSGKLRRVFLDKTGTLTEGNFALERILVDGVTEEQALAMLAALEAGSTHPIAAAIMRVSAERELETDVAEQLRVIPGAGVTGVIAGVETRAVSPRSFGELPASLRVEATATSVLLVHGGRAVALAQFGDAAKPDAVAAVHELERLGLEPELITGDAQRVATQVAAELGITRVRAELSPEDKLAAIRTAQQQGAVAMVGDGINDAAALAQADIGIAMGAGTDLARAASDITVLRSDAMVIPQAVRLTQATRRIIIGNLVWAFGYNVAAIPLAMAGLLGPMIAGAAMAFSSVFVVLNSVRLTRFK